MLNGILCTGSSTGQLVLWGLKKIEDGTYKLHPFTVLVSQGVPIVCVNSGISKFGDEVKNKWNFKM